MLKQFLNHINQNALCTPTQRIVLAVSGGLDSMVMLHIFKEAGYLPGVAHCNFQLRGSEADKDEDFVRQTCAQLGFRFHVTRFETEAYAQQHHVSIQMAARELRYSWFAQLLAAEGYDYVATAHHVNDAMETVLINWVNGSSVEGLAGIPVKNGQIIRPLLFATRAAIQQYSTENNITWREDASNKTEDYQRNFIRHSIIPKLKEVNPSLEETFQRGQRKIKGELIFLENQIEEWKRQHLKSKGNAVRIDKGLIYEPTYGAAFLWKVLRSFGFNFDQCENMLDVWHGQPGKQFISPSHRLTIDREQVIITSAETVWNEVTIGQEQTRAVLGSWVMEIEKQTSQAITPNPLVAVLDAGKLRFPLHWRTWRPGDYFYPLGMEHKRKLSDFLIDQKVSMADKHYLTVLESDGQIVWVVGHRIDNRFKVTPQTGATISFSVSPTF
jgi:tRNA(Ile)-lysidine synthase